MQSNKPAEKRSEKPLLDRCFQKLKLEAFLKSALWGLLAGAAAVTATAALAYLAKLDALLLIIGAFILFAAGTTAPLYFLRFRPTLEQAALRADGLGLEERTVTMLELAKKSDNSEIAGIQRQNTFKFLEKYRSANIGFRLFKKPVFCVLLASVLALSASGIVLSVSSVRQARAQLIPPPAHEAEILPEDRIIEELIEDLRELIDNSKVSDELKDKLHEIVDDMETDLENYDTINEKIAVISDTAERIKDIIERELAKKPIAEELQERDSTKELGEAIETEDGDTIDDAFDKILEDIEGKQGEEKREAANQIAKDIEDALNEAQKPDSALEKALRDLAEALKEAASDSSEPGESGDEKLDEAAEKALSEAGEKVKEALEGEKQAGETDGKMQERIEQAIDELEKLLEENEGEGEGQGEGQGEGEGWSIVK